MKLSRDMSLEEFDQGYWYADQIKDFAKKIGISSVNKLRKDELEKIIRNFLKTGKIENIINRKLKKIGIKDFDLGLHLDLPIVNYTSNKKTKEFIVNEAIKIDSKLKRKSGVKYRLNRWREDQLTKGIKITYRDLVNQYVLLNQVEKKFDKIDTTCYINFVADYLKNEITSNRKEAIIEWKKLKKMPISNDYKSWRKYKEIKN